MSKWCAGLETISMSKRWIIISAIILAIIGVGVFFVQRNHAYTSSNDWQEYSTSQVSFRYPSQWDAQFCGERSAEFVLPSTVAGVYRDSKHYPLVVKGYADAKCEYGKMHFSSLPSAVPEDCKDASLIRLDNGLALKFHKLSRGTVWKVTVNSDCTSGGMFEFEFYDPKNSNSHSAETALKWGEPAVDLSIFRESAQYKDIVKLAKSIKIDK